MVISLLTANVPPVEIKQSKEMKEKLAKRFMTLLASVLANAKMAIHPQNFVVSVEMDSSTKMNFVILFKIPYVSHVLNALIASLLVTGNALDAEMASFRVKKHVIFHQTQTVILLVMGAQETILYLMENALFVETASFNRRQRHVIQNPILIAMRDVFLAKTTIRFKTGNAHFVGTELKIQMSFVKRVQI